MAPPPPPPPPAPDFDSAEYDALQQRGQQTPEAQMEQAVRGCFEDIMHRFHLAVHEHRAHKREVADAVDSCLATCLEVIDMQYPAREDNPVSAVSLEHNSWEPEAPPDPCTLDSWLRSALPEAQPPAASSSGRESWVMQQFLTKQPSIRRSLSGRSNEDVPIVVSDTAVKHARSSAAGGEGGGTGSGGVVGAGRRGGASREGGQLAGASMRSIRSAVSRRHVTKLDTRKVLTAEQEQLEEQLRQELAQRKAQEEMSKRLEQKDAEERAKLSALRKELKGKDYTYDHKGEVVILHEFDPERTPLEALSGPGYKVALPEDPSRALSPKKRNTLRSMSTRSMAALEAAAAAAARANTQLSPTEMRKERDRRLASDFKKMAPKTQPSALDTLLPAGGVTLRGAGGATKTGPLRQPVQGITKEAYAKQVAKKALLAQQEKEAAAHGPQTPMSPATGLRGGHSMFREPLAAHRGATQGGGGTARSVTHGSIRHSMTAKEGLLHSRSLGAASAVAAARQALLVEKDNDPLAAYDDDKYDPFAGARLKPRNTSLKVATPPDVNLTLTEAGDWGSAGLGKAFEAPPALPHAKPTDRQLVETIGRGERLPRERAPLPTLAPPLSPTKLGQLKSTDRLQWTSPISEPRSP
ncbi:hypothetical protein HYH03_014559 [Edaphochlamys debaryana]|uniref:Uncharacterized protein n=1 Tax=Edaphochlamys debaryana TaxID=47281 RepID=A0A836BS13_9CHLO|nr:hypothetical protein HYH03_014559 [Edaphochlamys debaryana]|eukprot:KAG2486760.1 hypothetical protein HYH03_014559 [Edaphochlamys debaryana]